MSSAASPKIRVQREPFDLGRELAEIKSVSRTIGGIVIFLGVARDLSRGRQVEKLFFEYYPGMAERTLIELRAEAMERFDLKELSLVHRHGELRPGDDIVLIVAAAEHREEAFRACSWCIAELKRRAPIWKKEYSVDGEVWVEDDVSE